MRSAVALVFLSVVLAAAGFLGIGWAVVSLGRGEYLTALVVACVAIFSFGMVVMLARLLRRDVTSRVDADDDGTTLRPDRTVDASLMVATIGMWLAMVCYAVFAPWDMVDIPLPRADRNYFVGAAIIGALAGLPTMRQIFVRRAMSFLRLSVDGVVMGNTYSAVYRDWGDITDVSDRPAPDRRPVNTGSTYITTTDGSTRLVASDWYTPGGHALRDLVRFYWQHPEFRDELTDGRSANRLRRVT